MFTTDLIVILVVIAILVASEGFLWSHRSRLEAECRKFGHSWKEQVGDQTGRVGGYVCSHCGKFIW